MLMKGFLQETGAGSHWLPAFVPELKKEEITCGRVLTGAVRHYNMSMGCS
jgi:hypothetical protein